MGEKKNIYIYIYIDSNFAQLYIRTRIIPDSTKTRNTSTWNRGAESGKCMDSNRNWWKKDEDDIGVQNPLAGPSGGPRFSIDAQSFIPLGELLYLCEWMSAQNGYRSLSLLPFCLLYCCLNLSAANFHARHVSRKSLRNAIPLSKEL